MTNVLELVGQLNSEGRHVEAHQCLARAAQGSPDNPTVLAMLRDSLLQHRKYEAALVLARRIVEVAPTDGVQWDRLGGVYMCLDRFDEAEVAITKALELTPELPGHWHQAALLEHRRNNSRRALDHVAEGFKLDPYGLALRHDAAHMKLAIGEDLTDALADYEVRWESLVHLPAWDLHLPEWQGEDLSGKRVLFHSEQGYGDALMMARFARDLVSRGAAEVGLCLPGELMRLFAAQHWPGVRVVDMTRLVAEEWDVHTPMYSALRWLGYQVNDIDPSPYLTQVPRVAVPPCPPGFRIGLCWGSGKWNLDTALRRLVPLELLLPLLEIPDVRLVSLQQGPCVEDLERLGLDGLIFNPMPICGDFAATAAVINQLDGVISVDTSMVHLAGAMGIPTFMLTQFTRCWRWWKPPSGLPWYETMTSARQTSPHDWSYPVNAAIEWVKGGCR